MATLLVPREYSTIQSAINAARSGDTIRVAPGTYYENLVIDRKDNISLVGTVNTVVLDGSKTGGFGISVYANSVTIEGLVFLNFISGINITGDHSQVINVFSSRCARTGMNLVGNNNYVNGCRFIDNVRTGLLVSGDNNLFLANNMEGGERGFTTSQGSFKNNVIAKNLFIDNELLNIRINSMDADRNVIYDNILTDANYGIIAEVGRVAMWRNKISKPSVAGITTSVNEGIFLQNTISNTPQGIVANSNKGYFAYNVVQKCEVDGIGINGDENCIIRNSVNGCGEVGILVSGSYNTIRCNRTANNTVHIQKEGCHNVEGNEDCDKNCISWTKFSDTFLPNNEYMKLLNIFNTCLVCK